MSQQPPPGGWPPQPPDSPTQPNYPVPPTQPNYPVPPPQPNYPVPPPQPGYPPQPSYTPPGPTGYEAPPPPPGWQGPPAPPPGGTNPYQPPPPPADNNTSRNLIVGVVVALLLVLIVGAVFVFANQPPAPSFPVIIPTVSPPSAEPTKSPKSTPTQEPAESVEAPTEQPTEALPTSAEPTAEPSDIPSGPTAEPPTEAPPTEAPPSEGPGQPTPEPSQIPGVEDHGLILGSPEVIGDPATFQEVALLVQNIDVTVKFYTLKATFKDGDTITATATGIVSDHLPGTIRTPALFIDGTPGTSDTVTVQIDTMFSEDPSTESGDIAKQVTFGPPTINAGDFPTIDVEVTNGSDSSVSLTVAAGVMRDGVLVGVGTGVVNDMAPGQAKTASLYVTGSLAETDQLILTIDTALASP